MARLDSAFKFTGRIGDLSFYKMNGEYFVRRAGGPSRDFIRKSPQCERVRENITEFSACSSSGKILRQYLAWHFKHNDSYMYRRATSLLSDLLDFDTTSIRGSRTPAKALTTPGGRSFLRGFSFNLAETPNILLNEISFLRTNQITIHDLVVLRRLFPKGARTAEIKAGALALDLSRRDSQFMQYSSVTLSCNDLAPVILTPQNQIVSADPRFYIMQVKLFDKHGQPFRQGKADLLFIIKVQIDKPAPKLTGVPFEFPATSIIKRTVPGTPVFINSVAPLPQYNSEPPYSLSHPP